THTAPHHVRIGYLILAHNTPKHFARLVHALDDEHAQIYVHIDHKSDMRPFQAHVPTARVHFLQHRLPVYWNDYSTAQPILKLITAALSHDATLDCLCLLSGADYPLRSASYIRQFLTQHHGTEFISLVPMPNAQLGKPLARLTRVHLRHDRAQKLAHRL